MFSASEKSGFTVDTAAKLYQTTILNILVLGFIQIYQHDDKNICGVEKKKEPQHSIGLIHFPVVSLAVHLLKGEAKIFQNYVFMGNSLLISYLSLPCVATDEISYCNFMKSHAGLFVCISMNTFLHTALQWNTSVPNNI